MRFPRRRAVTANHGTTDGAKLGRLPRSVCLLVDAIHEEINLQGTIKELLGVVEYFWSFSCDEVCCHTHEVNFIYRLHIPDLTPFVALIPQEDHVAFKWFPLQTLEAVDLRPLPIKELVLKSL